MVAACQAWKTPNTPRRYIDVTEISQAAHGARYARGRWRPRRRWLKSSPWPAADATPHHAGGWRH